ncbi:MAG: leucine--tRNA ligase [Spirochaetaceae bacterium]|jgi:leucyl-tRNA synthetase|nr:leucine--tRNA ligase [Spirochaetaceae bacterium]
MHPFAEIEPKWQAFWEANKTFKTVKDLSYPKEKRRYVLDMFPYPSSQGLHVGHPEGYTATDIYCRYLRANGYNVLHPMGFDAFGLPAENYAIKTGRHPAVTTAENIDRFRRQIKKFGFSYDWDREINTSKEDYYRWTQWLFLQLYKKDLAYETESPINWCPSCKTGLANEEVKDGECDRCGTKVTRKRIRQWALRITAYAERLLDDLDELDWPLPVKLMQRNWIGKSEGANVVFTVANDDKTGEPLTFKIYTTRPDTLFGVTYMVLAPEHSLVEKITKPSQKAAVEQYCDEASKKSDIERTGLAKTKSGVFTGSYAINPVNNAKIPIWIADYVLVSYGTGAIMAVPAHDERDWDFAKEHGLPVIQVVAEKDEKPVEPSACVTADGFLVNSGQFTGISTVEAKTKITEYLQEMGCGEKSINYKLRDWIFSRQRYWGEPIPVVHCKNCGVVTVPEKDLPLRLPDVQSYAPTGTGESPLANISEWVNTVCPKCGAPAKRETNTMPQWAGSCWYYLRYLDPNNETVFASREEIEYWMPVDLYIGGTEHAVLHLLYSRFWHKVFYDLGLVNTKEPFKRLINQGMILGEDNQKMSKSRGNVVNPDDIIKEFGADAMRIYEMFMGPLETGKPWITSGLTGISRFLDRIWAVSEKVKPDADAQKTHNQSLIKLMHKTIKKVTGDTATLNFNTAISAMMVYSTELAKEESVPQSLWTPLVIMLAAYAPHLGEELWQKSGGAPSVSTQPWPVFDEALTVDTEKTIVVQINGKNRDKFIASAGAGKNALEKLALSQQAVQKWMEGKTPKKIIVVPDKLVNIVV